MKAQKLKLSFTLEWDRYPPYPLRRWYARGMCKKEEGSADRGPWTNKEQPGGKIYFQYKIVKILPLPIPKIAPHGQDSETA